jgi:hypothetical protein
MKQKSKQRKQEEKKNRTKISTAFPFEIFHHSLTKAAKRSRAIDRETGVYQSDATMLVWGRESISNLTTKWF